QLLCLLLQFLQYAQAYTYADPFHSMWMHNFLPSHSSFYWMRPRPQGHETQQYEYSMPVHPPPLPSQQTPTLLQQPGIQEQPRYPFTNLVPTRQVQQQQYDTQPPFQQNPFALPEGNQPVLQQQLPSPDRQTQQVGLTNEPCFSVCAYCSGTSHSSYMVLSSEEMQGGGLGAPAYRAAGPNFFALDARLGNMPVNIGQPGDYTVEDDQLGITEQPEVQGGANPGANPSGKGNQGTPLEANQGGAMPNGINLLHPASQSKGPSDPLAQATADPLATQGLLDGFIPPDAADTAMPLDPTMFPEAIYTTNTGNEAGLPQAGQDAWHFQEP
uniref:Ameloblastin n=1 Tax=Varanus komodoensis TaxID=61221 RepID=A0A8D2IMW0_VARKO